MSMLRTTRAPRISGTDALVLGPIVYLILQQTTSSGDSIAAREPDGLHSIHFLLHVFISFGVCTVTLATMTLIMPLKEPVQLPVREEISLKTDRKVYIAGSLVIIAVLIIVAMFW